MAIKPPFAPPDSVIAPDKGATFSLTDVNIEETYVRPRATNARGTADARSPSSYDGSIRPDKKCERFFYFNQLVKELRDRRPRGAETRATPPTIIDNIVYNC